MRTLRIVIALAAIGIGGSALAEAPVPAQLWTEKPVGKALDPDAPVSMRAFSVLAKELSPAVVNISVERKGVPLPMPFVPNGGTGLGTGVIIHKSGYLLTNNHVVEGADAISVRLSNEHEYPAAVVGTYPPLDIALLKVDATEPLVAAPLGDSEALEIGEWVIAIGNPFGLNHTVTAGIVSAKGRRDVAPGSGNRPNHARFIQTDASINPGNSGGPLINIRGEVIGINTAINAAGQGIGFAVPIDMVKTVLPQLARGKVSRSYLGVLVGPVKKDTAEQLGLERGGALVTDVKPDTPAAKAGMKTGDVITGFDGKRVEHWEDLPWLASTAGSARAVKLTLNREGKTREVSLTLAPFPEDEPVSDRDPAELGLVVAPVPKERLEASGLRVGEGVLVKEVRQGGAADELGVEAGDIIAQINYVTVKGGAAGFDKLVASIPRGQPLALTIRRGDRVFFKVVAR